MTWRKKTQKTMSPNKEKTSLKRHRNVALNDNSPQVHFQGLYSVLRVSKERRVGGEDGDKDILIAAVRVFVCLWFVIVLLYILLL